MIETAPRWEVGLAPDDGIDGRDGAAPECNDRIPTEGQQGRNRGERSSLLAELHSALGESAALKLIEAFGGSRIYVPHLPHPGDALVAQIGMIAAAKLVRLYGGERLELPNPNSRRGKILELRRSGHSVDAIARQMGCTRRRVFQVLAEARPAREQGQPETSPQLNAKHR